jgi:hypothetical protein
MVEANLGYGRDVLVHPTYQSGPDERVLTSSLSKTQRTDDSYVSWPALRRNMCVRDPIRASILYDIPQVGRDTLWRALHDL